MTSEEIHLNDALEAAGTEVVESDLGEFIQQLRKEPPFHFVFPCMHVKRDEINKLFQDNIQSRDTDNPAELTMIAREYLRQKYLDADMGITGANFIVAQDGMISVTENEGNSRLSAAMPKIHLVLVGIEKVVPRLEDLALFLPMPPPRAPGNRSRATTRNMRDRARRKIPTVRSSSTSLLITTARNCSPTPNTAMRFTACVAARV